MKKYDLTKLLGITFLVGVLLTWLIPISGFQEGEFLLLSTSPLGFFDIIKTPLAVIANFIHYGMFILAIGGLYGVMNQTGAYAKIINSIVSKYKNNKEQLLAIIMIFFISMASLFGINELLIILVPFATTLLFLLNYEKLTVLSATIGSILIGNLGSLYSTSINTPLYQYFEVSVHNQIVTKIIFLIIISYLFISFVIKTAKTRSNEKKELSISLYDKKIDKTKNIWPLVIILSVSFVFLLIAMFDWNSAFGVQFFDKVYTTLMEVEVNGYPIIRNIIGSINPLGRWNLYDLTIMLMVITLIIGWLYSLSLEKITESFTEGLKQVLPVAFYVTLANILFAIIYTGQSGAHFFNTIANFLLSIKDKFTLITMSLTSIIGSFIFNDFGNFTSVMANAVQSIYNNPLVYPVIAIIMQFMHGLVMFVAPTSLLLIIGLTYFDVSYKKWLLHIWQFLLKILAISIVVNIIVMMFV